MTLPFLEANEPQSSTSLLRDEEWFVFLPIDQRNQIIERLCGYLKWVIERNPTLLHVSIEELTGFFMKDLEQLSWIAPNLAFFAHVNEWLRFHVDVAEQFEVGNKPVLKSNLSTATLTPSQEVPFVSATVPQMNFLKSLALRHHVALPSKISKEQASKWITELKEKGTLTLC